MIAVPLRITGPFSKPVIEIDAEALLRSGAQNQLKRLLGDDKDDGEPATAEDAVRGVLGDLLGGGASKEENGRRRRRTHPRYNRINFRSGQKARKQRDGRKTVRRIRSK